ncbi:DUF4132 domain-containing protein [Paenibacillus daejeonensis]|uniref:DUF4132 domain-containing protein n=1 Tax=Paenibacillus daejeonensis TaxID=135193 RepID=UPI00037C842D|nr:DUF4132 domain-containing protein [Paenibacillus daejeonensis]
MLTEDKVLPNAKAEKCLKQLVEDYNLDVKDAERVRDFVSGQGTQAPNIKKKSHYYGFSTMDALRKLGADSDADEDTRYRLGALLLRIEQSHWAGGIVRDVVGITYDVGGLRDRWKLQGARASQLQEPLVKLLDYAGEEQALAMIEESLQAGGLGVRQNRNAYMLVQGLLLLQVYALARPAVAQSRLDKLPPLVRAVVMEQADEVDRLLRELLARPLAQPSNYRDPRSSLDLDSDWRQERRERAMNGRYGSGTSFSDKERVSKQAVEDAIWLTTSLLLYRMHAHGTKSRLLAEAGPIDQWLLQAVRELHEVYPFEVREGLLALDSRWSAPDELLEGLVPLDEPFYFIEQLRDALDQNYIPWKKVSTLILAEPELSRRAYAILEHPFISLVIHKTLAEHGEELPENAGTVEAAALAMMRAPSYGSRYGLLLSRYLGGEMTKEAYLADPTSQHVFNNLNRDQKRIQVVIASTYQPLQSEAARRLARIVTAEGMNTRACLSELYQSDVFDGPQLLAVHGEDPEVNRDKLLEALILLNGLKGYSTYGVNYMPENDYRQLLSSHLGEALATYDELSTYARELVIELALEQGDRLQPELRVAIFRTGLSESSKKLRRKVLSVFASTEDAELYKQVYQAEKKAAIKELTLGLLRRTPEAKTVLGELLVKEKNAGLKQLIEVLQETADQGPAQAHAALARQADAKKSARLAWISMGDLPDLKDQQGQPLDPDVRTYILLQSVDHNTAPNELLEEMESYVDRQSLADLTAELIRQWIQEEAPAKEKWVLHLGALFGDRQLISLLGNRIKGWAENSRGAVAAEAVKILSYVKETSALIAIDNFKRTIKNKQVRGAAEEALELAAENAGLTPDQLADRLISSLGFDNQGVQTFSYGPRSFEVRVTPDLQLSVVQTDTGKAVKSLPAAGAKDDADQAKQAKAAFNQLKKDLKTMAGIQLQRLEESLSKQRLWSAQEWKDLFVENVIMHQFAIGLIWGVYADGKLVQTFRYMDDGTFNTVDEEEYDLAGDAQIGLVHSLELDQEELAGWKTQLADYEIKPPFEQLERPVYLPEEEERQLSAYLKVPDDELSPTGFPKALEKYGWTKGPVEDGGWYHEFSKDYGDLIAELRFSGTSIAYYEGLEKITLQGLYFFKNKRKAYHSYYSEDGIKLGSVPTRVFSESVYDVLRASGR